MRSRRALAVGVLALAASGAASCSTYHYYDINVSMNVGGSGSFNAATAEVTEIQRLVMTVSGADSGKIVISAGMGIPISTGGAVGVVEYSTFADSGTLNFTVDAFDSQSLQANCNVGEGTLSMMATGNTTNTGMLTVNRSTSPNAFCCTMGNCP